MNRHQLTVAASAQLARTRFAGTRPAAGRLGISTRPAASPRPSGRHAGTRRTGGWPVGARRPAGRHARQRHLSTHRAVVFARRLAITLAAMGMVAIGLATMVEA
jgi:hypothetical protein